jgi:serine/threonine protein kinase
MQPNGSESPKKVGDDVERNTRHSDVVDLLSGRKILSPRFSQRYKIGEVLGDGAFGFVLTAKSLETGSEVAVKFIIKSKIPKELWNQDKSLPVEIQILRGLNHPNIIKYIEHIIEDKYILLITELHGTEWSVNNPKLSPLKNPGLRNTPRGKAAPNPESKMECSPLFRLTEEQERAIKRRTSCDLFECIDARMILF